MSERFPHDDSSSRGKITRRSLIEGLASIAAGTALSMIPEGAYAQNAMQEKNKELSEKIYRFFAEEFKSAPTSDYQIVLKDGTKEYNVCVKRDSRTLFMYSTIETISFTEGDIYPHLHTKKETSELAPVLYNIFTSENPHSSIVQYKEQPCAGAPIS